MSSYTDILNNIDKGAQTVSGLGGRFASLWHYISDDKSSTPAHVRDLNTNGFLSQNSVFAPGYFIRAFDEPTYLSFRIEFNFDDEQRNIAYSDMASNYGSILYPNMYDFMPEPFLQNSASVFLPGPESATTFGKRYCTEYYLDYVLGDHGRAKLLHKLKQALKDVQDNFPYYFESVEGLGALNAVDPKKGKRLNNCVLTIKCSEGLDMKITQILQMVRKVMWDDVYQRWALPDMMRYFSMKIFVSEIRLFHEMRPTTNLNRDTPTVYDFSHTEVRNATTLPSPTMLDNIMRTTDNILNAANTIADRFFNDTALENGLDLVKDTVGTAESLYGTVNGAYVMMCANAISRIMPTICFDCHLCEFDISNTFSTMTSLTSTAKEPQKQEIKIKVGQVLDYQTYPLDINLRVLNDEFEVTRPNTRTGEDRNPKKVKRTTYVLDPFGRFSMDASSGNSEITGATIMADPAFDKQLRPYDPSAYLQGGPQEGYRTQRIDEYNRNVVSAFNDIGYFTQLPGPGDIYRDDTPRNGFYNPLLAGAVDNFVNIASADGKTVTNYSLRYKRDTLDSFTSITTMLTSGLGTLESLLGDKVNLSGFSKATGISHETLQKELPDIYASATALKNMYNDIRKSDTIGVIGSDADRDEIAGNVYLSVLNDIGTNQNTAGTSLGKLARILMGKDYPSMATQYGPGGQTIYSAVPNDVSSHLF